MYINHVIRTMAHLWIPPRRHEGHLWWQPDDFVNFLRTRLDIAEAYKAAAHSLGVDTWLVGKVMSFVW